MTLPKLEDVEDLPGPFEILEMADGETRAFGVTGWQLGKAPIQPRDGRPKKVVLILRVHVPPEDKATLPDYWDITAQHLAAGLHAYLERGKPWRHRFTITKHGEGARGRFTLQVAPVARGTPP